MSKSQQIRELYNKGLTVAQVAEEVGVRYQFVYNVVSRMCNKQGVEVRKANPITTSQRIRELVDEGLTVGQIAKKLNTNYVFVHQVVKRYLKDKEEA